MKASALTPLFCLLFLFPLMSCGQGGSSDETGGGEEAVAEGLSPAELGEAIVSTYREAIGDVVELTEGLPEAANIRDDAVALKEKYVQKFVAYGKQKENMSEADKATVNSKLRIGASSFYSDPTFKTYIEATNHYMSTDRELHKILADFNIITQYADFELLRKQEPAEAQRLGL